MNSIPVGRRSCSASVIRERDLRNIEAESQSYSLPVPSFGGGCMPDDSIDRPSRWSTNSSWDRSKDPIILDWDRVRSQIQHEDLLINHRITWLIQINAMLLAAFGAGVYFIKDPSRSGALSLEQISVSLLLAVLIFFGALVSYITFRSVKIANSQIDWLVQWWITRTKGEAASHHPRLVGAPEAKVDNALRYAYVVPITFTALWLGLAFAYYFNSLADAASQMQRDWIYGTIIVVLVLVTLFQRRTNAVTVMQKRVNAYMLLALLFRAPNPGHAGGERA